MTTNNVNTSLLIGSASVVGTQDLPDQKAALATLQAILASSTSLLNTAQKNLDDAIAASLGVKAGGRASITTSASGAAAVGDADPTQTETDVEAASLMCQINDLIEGDDGKDPAALRAAVDNLKDQLQALKIANPDVAEKAEALIKRLTLGPPSQDMWKQFWNDNNISLTLGQWLGSSDLDVDFSQLGDKKAFQMNLMHVLISLTQNPSSVQGASLDDLFWGKSQAIYQTVAAYYMDQNNGDWDAAKNGIQNFLQTLPKPGSNGTDPNPNYTKFYEAIAGLSTTASCPVDPEMIFSDAFGFAEAWADFRMQGNDVYSGNILFGN